MSSLLRPAVGSILWFFIAPGTVAGLVPWVLTRGKAEGTGSASLRWIGAAVFFVGLLVVGEAFVRFVRQGRGTPAPVLPPERLVVTGRYRHVRNPMYLGVLAMIVGEALFSGSRAVLLYGAGLAAVFHLFVRLYEEPYLRRRFGTEYEAYCRAVRRWRPRLRPWTPAA